MRQNKEWITANTHISKLAKNTGGISPNGAGSIYLTPHCLSNAADVIMRARDAATSTGRRRYQSSTYRNWEGFYHKTRGREGKKMLRIKG